MNHPFFEPRKFSDAELAEKIIEINKRIYSSHFFLMSPDIKANLYTLLDLLNFEFRERQKMEVWEVLKDRLQAPIESDKEPKKVVIEKPSAKPIRLPKKSIQEKTPPIE